MSDANMTYLYTIGGYATLFGLGYVIYHVSTQKSKKRAGAAQARGSKTAQPEPRKEDRKKKQRLETFASVAAKPSPQHQPSDSETWLSNAQDKDTADDGAANREFAKQLAKAKEGTKFATKAEGGKQREKSVKQSRANAMTGLAESEDKSAGEEPSGPSSSTGADADDDQSPVGSPAPSPADASGVADMLEPAAAGPSVLRLTDTEPKKQKTKAAKAPEPVETKKQRQNRKKAEAAKAARQDAEQERKAQEEKQRRQARIAEGRAAKDGSQFMASNGNKSAWTQGAPNGTTNTSAKVSTVSQDNVLHAPLDTFEQPAASSNKKQPATSRSEDAWMSSLPSEEEQLEMLKDEADEWSTVKTKSSKKASKNDSSLDTGDKPMQGRPEAQPKQATASTKAKAASNQNFGSFSALTTKDEPADDAEEEWDV